MAKTLKLNVTFPMTIVVNSETVVAVESARKEAREALSKAAENGEKVKGEAGAFLKLFASELSTEKLLETLTRKGIREVVRKELTSELNNAETSVRVGDIKVTYETPKIPCGCNRTKEACLNCPEESQRCPLHPDDKACTSLCRRMLVAQ